MNRSNAMWTLSLIAPASVRMIGFVGSEVAAALAAGCP
jgi:hypothetical protein